VAGVEISRERQAAWFSAACGVLPRMPGTVTMADIIDVRSDAPRTEAECLGPKHSATHIWTSLDRRSWELVRDNAVTSRCRSTFIRPTEMCQCQIATQKRVTLLTSRTNSMVAVEAWSNIFRRVSWVAADSLHI
jgi:hypothetical protein